MFVNWLIRLVATMVASLALFRGVRWSPVLHLLDESMDDVFENFGRGNYLWPERWSRNPLTMALRFALPLMSPLGLLILAGITSLLLLGGTMDLNRVATTFAWLLGVLFVAIPIIAFTFIRTTTWMASLAAKHQAQEEPYVREYLRPPTVEFLSFSVRLDSEPRTYRTLPRERRTLRLLLQSVKARVCRPYSR